LFAQSLRSTLIDTGFPNGADKILAAIRQLGRASSDLRHIILTHAHFDRIGSLAAIARATGARTYMHPLDAPIAERGSGFRTLTQPAPGLLPRLLFKVFARRNPTVESWRIDQTVSDGEVLPIAGALKVIHVPGPAPDRSRFCGPRSACCSPATHARTFLVSDRQSATTTKSKASTANANSPRSISTSHVSAMARRSCAPRQQNFRRAGSKPALRELGTS
jgi:hypothetical protein